LPDWRSRTVTSSSSDRSSQPARRSRCSIATSGHVALTSNSAGDYDEEQTMRLASGVASSLLYGLSWILLGVAALMVVLAIVTSLGLTALPISVRTDLIGAAVCSSLALSSRFMARRFERPAYLS
jgi:hypothetical protein